MSKTLSNADFREILRGAGLKVTASRVAVLGVLHASGRATSHPEVVAALAAEGWDRATLYRNLIDLVDAGLLRRVDLGDHVWRFEVVAEAPSTASHTAHAHFICTECGEVVCLPPVEISAPPASDLPTAFRRRELEVQVRGICDHCLDARAPAHIHGPACGHVRVLHGDHLDWLDEGRLRSDLPGQDASHALEVDAERPDACTRGHACRGHGKGHEHGEGCGHLAVPHGDHIDYLVEGHLHHPHRGHCDDHGKVATQ